MSSTETARRLLIVDDQADLRELLTMALELSGFVVTSVGDLDSARTALGRAAFDLVLSDFLIGTRDTSAAWQGVGRVRALASPTPVAIMSGLALSPVAVHESGVAFSLLKPFSIEDLLARIAATFARASPEREIAVVDQYFRAIELGDWKTLGGLCSENVEYHLPGGDSRFSRTVVGRAAFAQFAEETFRQFPEPRFEILSVRPLPLGTIVEYVSSWRTDHGRGRSNGYLVFTMQDRAIATIGVRIDLEALRQAMAS